MAAIVSGPQCDDTFWRCGRRRVSMVVADGLNQYRIIAIHIQERTSAKLTIENNICSAFR